MADQTTRVRIESLAHGGTGVGRQGGRPVFVAGTAAGDLVEALVRDRGSFLEGRLLRVVEPGPARVATRCVHVEVCRGCHWQQVSVEAQREAKRANLIEALVRIGRIPRESLPPVGLVPSPESFRYRRRARFMVDASSGQLGYARSRGRPGILLRECHLVAEPIESLVLGLSALLRTNRPRPHHVAICAVDGKASVLLEYELGWSGPVRQVRQGERSLPPPDSLRHQMDLVKQMFEEFPFLAGVVVTAGPTQRFDFGEPELFDGTTFLRPDAFGQANQAVNERLVRATLEALNPASGDRVIELFSGNGNFTIPLARCASEVLAIEGSEISVELLRHGLKVAALSNVAVRPGDVAAVVRALVEKGRRFDLALLDPPRAGGNDLMKDLARLGLRRIAYVSCDPATLARDLESLLARGYRLEAATVFDQFPQTYHLEALALLSHAG